MIPGFDDGRTLPRTDVDVAVAVYRMLPVATSGSQDECRRPRLASAKHQDLVATKHHRQLAVTFERW